MNGPTTATVGDENYRRLVQAQYGQAPIGSTSMPNAQAQARYPSSTHKGQDQTHEMPNGVNGTSTGHTTHTSPRTYSPTPAKPAFEAPETGEGSQKLSQRASLIRSKTDINLSSRAKATEEEPELDWDMRHGWEDQYRSEEYLNLLSSVSPPKSSEC